jgi:predicted small lipoprotein YifL
MRRFSLSCVLAAVALLAGCGSKAAAPPSDTATPAAAAATATPTPTVALSKGPDPLTSPADLAACAQLEQAVQAVSSLVGHTTEGITQGLRPDELAKLTGTARSSLLDSAKLIELVPATAPLVGSQRRLAQALRMFAADFGRAKASALKGDLNKAAQQTVDKTALRRMQLSVKRIDDLCGA